eukprot:CAMPEP_0180172522 /NCGR_PEP_ID=MMETSP0986-20121125/35076_1 /TAXON_ID=697907 /ORGANISM="non described non described, Strain CCMP2293" /LENGTH=252 /DNA_ID=CAMNT_0022124627 /DNA_START=173 /DNA_END=930 /DNA_ORIENTATION=+
MAESQSQGLAFLAKTDNARQIANILSSLHVKKDIEAYVVAESSGLRFTVQKHNCLQMHVYLKRELFNVLECDAKHEFGINLTLLLECLNIFQTSTNFVALQISYAGEGKPLLLVMTDSGVVSKGGIHTQEVEEPADFCWAQSHDLKRPARHVRDRVRSKQRGGAGVRVRESECDVVPLHARRHGLLRCLTASTLVATVFKALSLSEKACLRVNEAGMLSMQLMIKDETAVTTFVEVLICADVMDEDGMHQDF